MSVRTEQGLDLPRGIQRAGVIALALLFSLACPDFASAEPESPLSLSWQAPSACPNAGAVRADVLKLAGGGTRPGHLGARGVIDQDAGGWHLVLTTSFEGLSGERRLSASSCRALTDAAVLLLALILNPESEAAARPAAERADETPEAAPAAPPSPEKPWSIRGLFAVHGGVHAGITGSLGPEVGLGVGVAVERVSLRVSGTYGPPTDVHVTGSSGPGGTLWFVSGAALGCWELGGTVAAGPCIGMALTRVAGKGLEVSTPDSATTSWASVMFGLAGSVRLHRIVSATLGGYGLVPTRRPSLYLDDLGQVQRPAAFGGELRAGAELSLP